MKVFLDDVREAPEGYVQAKDVRQAIDLLITGEVSEISLDHDLGDENVHGTGYGVLLWIENRVHTENWIPPKMIIHSANPPAREKMQSCIESINNMIDEREDI